MATKKRTTIDVPALADALKRFLKNREGAYFSAGGYYSGPINNLFFSLCDDWEYFSVAARPHESRQLSAALRSNATALHSDHGVIVSIGRHAGQVELHLAKPKEEIK